MRALFWIKATKRPKPNLKQNFTTLNPFLPKNRKKNDNNNFLILRLT